MPHHRKVVRVARRPNLKVTEHEANKRRLIEAASAGPRPIAESTRRTSRECTRCGAPGCGAQSGRGRNGGSLSTGARRAGRIRMAGQAASCGLLGIAADPLVARRWKGAPPAVPVDEIVLAANSRDARRQAVFRAIAAAFAGRSAARPSPAAAFSSNASIREIAQEMSRSEGAIEAVRSSGPLRR